MSFYSFYVCKIYIRDIVIESQPMEGKTSLTGTCNMLYERNNSEEALHLIRIWTFLLYNFMYSLSHNCKFIKLYLYSLNLFWYIEIWVITYSPFLYKLSLMLLKWIDVKYSNRLFQIITVLPWIKYFKINYDLHHINIEKDEKTIRQSHKKRLCNISPTTKRW